jgi:hypothetical protein
MELSVTTDDTTSGGGDGGSGGTGGNGDSVSYETHRKLLAEKKAAAAKLAEYEAKVAEHERLAKERETAELEKQRDYEKLKANLQDELRKRDESLAQLEAERATAKKLDAFFKALDGNLDRRYWSLIDIDQIVVDPATKAIDEMSVTKYLEGFRKEYPEIIAKPGRSTMPNEKANGAGKSTLTLAEWKALPLKDRKARISDVKLQ